MDTQCTKCGALYEVGESQKNSYMFCLECDKFFKIDEISETPEKDNNPDVTFDESMGALDEKENSSFDEKIKTAFKKLFVSKKKSAKPAPEPVPVLEADPPKMSEEAIAAATKRFALIDDFLEPEADFENEPEDVPLEYVDFLSVGLDIYSSDLIENHGKNKPDDHSPQKEQE